MTRNKTTRRATTRKTGLKAGALGFGNCTSASECSTRTELL